MAIRKRPSMSNSKGKVALHLVRDPDAADIAALFESLTGRKPTPEDMAEVEATLAAPDPDTRSTQTQVAPLAPAAPPALDKDAT